jgi:hypothetical protein
MTRRLRRLVVLSVVSTVAFAVTLSLTAHERALALAAYLAALTTLGLLALRAASLLPLPIDRQLLGHRRRPPRPPDERPAQFTQIETTLRRGHDRAADLDTRLRPLLYQVATARLAERHGIGMAEQPERARRLLGEHLWRFLIDPARPSEWFAPGLPLNDLHRLIEQLEAL